MFSKKIYQTIRYFFARLDEKRKLLGNFEKISKIFDENSIEKLNFYFIFRKFVTKNRAFGNNTSFLQQFFRFRGGFPPFPLAMPLCPAQDNCPVIYSEVRSR